MSELELLIWWIQKRPNNAALIATDDGEAGFMVSTLEGDGVVYEAEGLSIGDAIRTYMDKYGDKAEQS